MKKIFDKLKNFKTKRQLREENAFLTMRLSAILKPNITTINLTNVQTIRCTQRVQNYELLADPNFDEFSKQHIIDTMCNGLLKEFIDWSTIKDEAGGFELTGTLRVVEPESHLR